MGGKTGTTTQQSSVSIPPEVLARYNSVNARAERTAEQPFTPYSGEFVAPLTGTQQAGISNINQAQGMATPYYNNAGQAMNTGYQAGSGLALASAGAVNPEALTGQNINQYMSPYLGSVVDTTMANLRQQQGEEQSQILGNQIRSGAFGGDRGRIAQANLARQQGLATGQTVSGLMNQGYGQALQTAQQQQAQQLAASQANRAALAGAGQSLYSMGQGYGQGMAGLGTQAQQAALQGAQAQLGAGTVQQQTQQAQNTADYNQFLQSQGYPFQVAQFLANIAMGTGALSGSTTNASTTSPQSFFSDRRLKDDIEKIGKTFDGQDIVRYKYKGEPGTRIGLIAQDVEKHHPEAVGLAGGYRTVDYDKATDDAAERGHFAGGGLAGGYSSEGGAVMPEMAGMGFASGGAPDINSMLSEILNAHQGMYPYGKAGLYGQTGNKAGAYGTSQAQLPTRRLMEGVARGELVRASEQPGVGGQAMQGLNAAERLGSAYTSGSNMLLGSAPTASNPQGSAGLVGRGGEFSLAKSGPAGLINRLMGQSQADKAADAPLTQAEIAREPVEDISSGLAGLETMATGGLVRGHYAMGGLPFSEVGGYIPEAVLDDNDAEKNKKAMDSFTPKPAGAGQSGSGSGPGLLGTLGQIGGAIKGAEVLGSAAAGAGEGIGALMAMLPFSDRRLKDDIEKIGKTFDGQDIVRYRYKGEPATQIGLIAQDVEKHHPGAVGLAGGYRTVDYRKATEDAADRGHFAGGGLAGVRHGYALDGEVLDAKQVGLSTVDNLDPEVERIRRGLSGVESGGRYNAVGRDVVRPGRETDRAYGRYQVMGENVGPWTEAAFGQRMTPDEFLGSSKAQDAVVRNQIQQNLNRYGNADDVASVWFSGRPVAQAGQSRDANNVSVPEYLRRFRSFYNAPAAEGDAAPTGRAGLRVPVPSDNTGLGAVSKQDMSGDGGSGTDQAAPTDYRAAVMRALNPETREAPNWMQRNQDWLVPLLSGVGAMAASPSRYLGAALLQGVGGGAQQYAAMQQRGEEQQRAREQLGVSRANTLVAQQREQVAEQQLREQMLQRVLQQFGEQLPNGMYRDPFSGQMVSPQRRMQIAMQMASGSSSSGTPARAPVGEAGAVPPAAGGTGTAPPAASETGAAPPAAGETGAAPPSTGGTPPAAGETGARPSATPPAAGETAAAPPAAGAPAAGGTPATRPANAPPRMPWDNPPQFVPEDDPVQLRAAARVAMNIPGQREEAVRLETLARRIEDGLQRPRDINGNLYNGFVLRREEEERQKGLLDRENEAYAAHVSTSPEIVSSINNAARLMTTTNVGGASNLISMVTSIARSIPGGSAVVPDFLAAIQATNETARKAALDQGFRRLQEQAQQGAGGRTNMALVEMMQTMADPSLGPEARYEIIARTLARQAHESEWFASLNQRPMGMSLQQYRQQFDQKHPLDSAIERVKSTMPGFAGMTPALRRQFGTSDAALPDNLRGSDYNPLAPFQMRTVNGSRQFLMNGVIYDDRGRQIERVTQ
jgi:hypothetical protein